VSIAQGFALVFLATVCMNLVLVCLSRFYRPHQPQFTAVHIAAVVNGITCAVAGFVMVVAVIMHTTAA
jgi:hypothetical protein